MPSSPLGVTVPPSTVGVPPSPGEGGVAGSLTGLASDGIGDTVGAVGCGETVGLRVGEIGEGLKRVGAGVGSTVGPEGRGETEGAGLIVGGEGARVGPLPGVSVAPPSPGEGAGPP